VPYLELVQDWYRAFWRASITVDFVRPDSELSGYDVVVAPSLFITDDSVSERLHAFAEAGGTLIVTFMSGIADARLHLTAGGYLGGLRRTLGVRIEEFAPLAAPEVLNRAPIPAPSTTLRGGPLDRATATLWTEYLHAESAEILSRFDEGDVADWPALTRNAVGSGSAWYLATRLDESGMDAMVAVATPSAPRVLEASAEGVEAVRRGSATFIINHRGAARSVRFEGADFELAPREVRILPR
jgi:beta-galactosidase